MFPYGTGLACAGGNLSEQCGGKIGQQHQFKMEKEGGDSH